MNHQTRITARFYGDASERAKGNRNRAMRLRIRRATKRGMRAREARFERSAS